MSESAAWLASPLSLSSPLWAAAAAVFGAIWGSFFNVCIARIPAGQSIVRPGSRCSPGLGGKGAGTKALKASPAVATVT